MNKGSINYYELSLINVPNTGNTIKYSLVLGYPVDYYFKKIDLKGKYTDI